VSPFVRSVLFIPFLSPFRSRTSAIPAPWCEDKDLRHIKIAAYTDSILFMLFLFNISLLCSKLGINLHNDELVEMGTMHKYRILFNRLITFDKKYLWLNW
jgi:hypothetical protein